MSCQRDGLFAQGRYFEFWVVKGPDPAAADSSALAAITEQTAAVGQGLGTFRAFKEGRSKGGTCPPVFPPGPI